MGHWSQLLCRSLEQLEWLVPGKGCMELLVRGASVLGSSSVIPPASTSLLQAPTFPARLSLSSRPGAPPGLTSRCDRSGPAVCEWPFPTGHLRSPVLCSWKHCSKMAEPVVPPPGIKGKVT